MEHSTKDSFTKAIYTDTDTGYLLMATSTSANISITSNMGGDSIAGSLGKPTKDCSGKDIESKIYIRITITSKKKDSRSV